MSGQIREVVYQDFNSNFKPHPLTGDVTMVKNEKAIGQAIKNLVLTSKYDSFYSSNKSGRVYESLFENFDPVVLQILEDNIKRVIQNFEPRAIVESVIIAQYAEAYPSKDGSFDAKVYKQYGNMIDQNELNIQVIYRPINSRENVTLDIIVEKIR